MRLRTYLAPGIPLALFQAVGRELSHALDQPVEVTADARFSGPPPGEPNPLVDGHVDLAFMCGPSFLRMADRCTLVAAAPVFDDPRTGGRPQYFAEVIVARHHTAVGIRDLTDARFAINDPLSLSGCLAVLASLGSRTPPQIATIVDAGSSESALDAVERGQADVCSIDSVVWRRLSHTQPERTQGFRVLESLGPFPIQPVVAAPHVPAADVAAVASALRAIPATRFAGFGVLGFAPVTEADYLPLGTFLAVL